MVFAAELQMLELEIIVWDIWFSLIAVDGYAKLSQLTASRPAIYNEFA